MKDIIRKFSFSYLVYARRRLSKIEISFKENLENHLDNMGFRQILHRKKAKQTDIFIGKKISLRATTKFSFDLRKFHLLSKSRYCVLS